MILATIIVISSGLPPS